MSVHIATFPFVAMPSQERATAFGIVAEREPGESLKDQLILEKLGKIGWERLYEFRNYYPQGWGEGDGKPVSPRALEALYRFLEALKLPFGMVPSIYLLHDGSLGLAWEDGQGKAIEVTFGPNEISFYQESDEVESELPHRQAAELARYLTSAPHGQAVGT